MSKILSAGILAAALLLSGCVQRNDPTVQTPIVPVVTKDIESATFGAAQSAVNLEIYSDFQCPACQMFHELIGSRLEKEYVQTNKLSIAYKNYPLPQHQNAMRDALGALCALSEGKYHSFADGMYALEKQKANADVSDAERTEVALKAGLDPANFAKCLSEAWYYGKVQSEMADGNRLQISGTPSSYLDGRLMKFKSEQEFFAILDAAIESASKK